MSCDNCYNGCTEITSDKCVKYTGNDIPALGIQKGDTLEFVENAIISFLVNTLDGSGIKPNISLEGVCTLVSKYITPCSGCSGPTLNEILVALISAACDLQEQIDNLANNTAALEQAYVTNCLSVENNTTSNTHNVLQAVVIKLCELDSSYTELINSLPSTYVALDDINNIISTYLSDNGIVGGNVKYYTKMVPYTVIPWFAPLSYQSGKFDGTGKGIPAGEYENVYLCNGLNGTPDMRGRVPVGVTDGTMLGATMSSAVNPAVVGNPNYAINSVTGANFITLTESQMPQHNHTVTVSDPGHQHLLVNTNGGSTSDLNSTNFLKKTSDGSGSDQAAYLLSGSATLPSIGLSENKQTGINVSLANSGSNESHANIQPSIGCYYIMYIPA